MDVLIGFIIHQKRYFTINRENKWVKGKSQLYDVYDDEIEEIKEANIKQKKYIKSSVSEKKFLKQENKKTS